MLFYPNSGSGTVTRMVTYNYLDSTPERPVWTTGTLARSAWQDSAVFGQPHAPEYTRGATTATTNKTHGIGCTDVTSKYLEHKNGLEKVREGPTNSLTQPAKDYDEQIQQSLVRDIDSIVQKLNTTFQQDLKEEAEAEAYFFG